MTDTAVPAITFVGMRKQVPTYLQELAPATNASSGPVADCAPDSMKVQCAAERMDHAMRWSLVMVALALIWPGISHADDLVLVDNGKSDYRIVVASRPRVQDYYAARMLAEHVTEMTGVSIPIVEEDDLEPVNREIVVGFGTRLNSSGIRVTEKDLGPEEILLRTRGQKLFVLGGTPRGVIYAANTLLRDHWGCRWFAPDVVKIPHHDRLAVPALNTRYAPPFEWRHCAFFNAHTGWRSQNPEANADWAFHNFRNSHFTHHERPELERGGVGGFNYRYKWHTYYDIVSPEKYFDAHPEYFSLRDGKRVCGSYSEYSRRLYPFSNEKTRGHICCTNPDLPGIFAAAFREAGTNPWWARTTYPVFSASHDDWSSGQCECDACRELRERYGGRYSANQIDLCNRIAEELEADHPDWRVSMLAYNPTVDPPVGMKAHRNVLVHLADARACRVHPYSSESCERNIRFRERLRQWTQICRHVYVWMYMTNFHSFYYPDPTFEPIAENVRFLRDQGVTGCLMQGPGWSADGDMTELRAYLLQRLLWNPDLNAGSLRREFMEAYYGKVAPILEEYRKDLRKEFLAHDAHLQISNEAEDFAFITQEMLDRWIGILERAEEAAEDADVRRRVRRALLVPLFTDAKLELESARRKEKAETFVREAHELGVVNVADGCSLARFCDQHKIPRPGN